MKEHWAHCRHLEAERSWFMNVYMAIIAGAIAFLFKDGSVGLSEYHWSLGVFLVFLSLFGLGMTYRWIFAFEYHRKCVNKLINQIYYTTSPTIPTSITPGSSSGSDKVDMDIKPLWSSSVKNTLRTRRMFIIFYIAMCVGSISLTVIMMGQPAPGR